jgi:hypothetical protein
MRALGVAGIILGMSNALTSSKLLLVADPRPVSSERGTVPVRRYRLARLRLEGRVADPALRFEHLKRVYD